MNKSSVIFGATGLVGREIVYELLQKDEVDNICAVVRKKMSIANPRLKQIVINDFTSLDTIKAQLSADTYFCCIGSTIAKAGNKAGFRRVDFDIPVIIAGLASSLHIPNLVIISSISANAGSGNFYLRTKGEMEQEVQKRFKGNLKIVRPSMILGHRPEFRLGEIIGKGLITVLSIFLIGPLGKYKGINYTEIARGMINSVDLPKETIIVESDKLHKLATQNGKLIKFKSGMI